MVDATQHDLELTGCTPEPLMAYLKALGVLRLVSEQKDAEARGWWENDLFSLQSPLLFRDAATDATKHAALVRFFLEEYQPTPIVAPWNAGSGFYLKWDEKKSTFKRRDATDALLRIESSTTDRLQEYREQIRGVKEGLERSAKQVDPAAQIADVRECGKRERWGEKRIKDEVKKVLDGQMLLAGTTGETLAIGKSDKDAFVRSARSTLLRDIALCWIDTAFVIRTGHKKNRIEAPLLGSGGNIGNSDFSARFMQILSKCIPLADGQAASRESAELLSNAIFGGPLRGLTGLAADQFDPGRAGGANMYQGMEAGFRLNPWDYVLMLEGAVLLRGAASRRLASGAAGSSFPFAVESTPAGFVSAGSDTTRGEQWLPLWERACTAGEIATLLGEGRSGIGQRPVKTAVEFARAAAALGVDRGIKQFVRVQYQARFGDNYLANALGRIDVLYRDSVDLLRQTDPWLDRFRKAVKTSAKTSDKIPRRFASALRRIESAVFGFCKYGGSTFFQRILIALGRAERELALTPGKVGQSKTKSLPLAGLPADWIEAADDGSPEFSIAGALASVRDPEAKIGPLRANLEPVDWENHCRKWAEKNRAVVWNAADLAINMRNVLQRRLMDGARAGCERLPLASPSAVPLSAIGAFLANELDDERIEDLIWGLMLINGRGDQGRQPGRAADSSVPRAYALLKLLFLPRPLVIERSAGGTPSAHPLREGERGGVVIRPEPSILHLLNAGHLGGACAMAVRRLRASGLDPMPGPIRGHRLRDYDWRELDHMGGAGIDPHRLAAALLIPIRDDAVSRLVRLVIRGGDVIEDRAEPD